MFANAQSAKRIEKWIGIAVKEIAAVYDTSRKKIVKYDARTDEQEQREKDTGVSGTNQGHIEDALTRTSEREKIKDFVKIQKIKKS